MLLPPTTNFKLSQLLQQISNNYFPRNESVLAKIPFENFVEQMGIVFVRVFDGNFWGTMSLFAVQEKIQQEREEEKKTETQKTCFGNDDHKSIKITIPRTRHSMLSKSPINIDENT